MHHYTWNFFFSVRKRSHSDEKIRKIERSQHSSSRSWEFSERESRRHEREWEETPRSERFDDPGTPDLRPTGMKFWFLKRRWNFCFVFSIHRC